MHSRKGIKRWAKPSLTTEIAKHTEKTKEKLCVLSVHRGEILKEAQTSSPPIAHKLYR